MSFTLNTISRHTFLWPKHVVSLTLFFQLPGLILHIKAFTITKLDRKQKSESIDLTLVRSLVGGSVYIAWAEAFTLLGWKQVLSVNDVKQCLFVLLSPVWNRPMPLCCKTSSMLKTSRVYTLFNGQTDWFEKCSSSLDDRRSNMFFFILQWRFTMATFLVLQEKRICLAGGSQKMAKTQD